MKIALTGAGEFVAARLIETFQLDEGPSLAAIGRHPAELTAAARFAIDLRVADFFSIDSLARSFSGCSAVVHVIRHAAAEMKRGTSVLCRAAAQAGIRRIVFLSSADVHGLAPPAGATEKSPLHPQDDSPLPHALVAAERQFFNECRQLDIAGYALRAGFLFGPRSDIVAKLATDLEQEQAWLLQQGEGICNSLYVDNLIHAIRLALKAKTGAGSAFLLTDAETVTWREFYHTAAHELHVSPTTVHHLADLSGPANGGPPAPPHRSSPGDELLARQACTWKLPTLRATKDLGYQPRISFNEGMRRSCAWWRFTRGEFFAAA